MKKASFLIMILMLTLNYGCSATKPVNTTSQINTTVPGINNRDTINKTVELERSTESKGPLFEQLKYSLYIIDNKSPNYDREEFFKFVMNKFKDFLETEQAYKMMDDDFKKLSGRIHVFQLEKVKVITYEGNMLLFGEIGAPTYAFFQQKIEGKIIANLFYNNNHRNISSAIQPSNDKNFIVLTGRDKNAKPWRAFIDAFNIADGIVNKAAIIDDYQDNLWNMDSKDNTIFLTDSAAETYINKVPGQTIVLEAGDLKLNLYFDSKLQKYITAKNSANESTGISKDKSEYIIEDLKGDINTYIDERFKFKVDFPAKWDYLISDSWGSTLDKKVNYDEALKEVNGRFDPTGGIVFYIEGNKEETVTVLGEDGHGIPEEPGSTLEKFETKSGLEGTLSSSNLYGKKVIYLMITDDRLKSYLVAQVNVSVDCFDRNQKEIFGILRSIRLSNK
ncbi:MAG: hypothetical protein Q8920_05530 [Bacillota bacterium]|nr:hypothetical protein [Bacillota bacterium]